MWVFWEIKEGIYHVGYWNGTQLYSPYRREFTLSQAEAKVHMLNG